MASSPDSPNASGNPWQRTKVGGLYLHRPSGRYYSRIKHNGKRPFVALKTDVWSKAAAKHAARQAEIAGKRATGEIDIDNSGFRTLGKLTALLVEQLALTSQDASSKSNYVQHFEVLKTHWPAGSFETFPAMNVTFDVLLKLRGALKLARWRRNNGRKETIGYSNAYTNQVMARLSNVLTLARSRGICSHDPFAERVGLQGSIWLDLPKRTKDLPSLERFHAIFAEIERVAPGKLEEPGFVAWRRDRAIEASEHARFLAFTGCRLEEGNTAAFEDEIVDQRGRHWFHLRGTKSQPSDRLIYVFPALRDLLVEIRARRIAKGEPVTGRILRPHTSRNAIKMACERLNLPKMGHHTMRHYFATLALSQGVPVLVVAQWLGHSDKGATLLKVYAHVIREDSAAWGEKLSFSPPPAAQSSGA